MRVKKYGALLRKVAGNFWKDISTPAWLAVWEQFAAQTGAAFKRPKFLQRGHLLIEHQGFQSKLTNPYSDEDVGTLIQTPLEHDAGLSFTMRRKSVLTTVGAALGYTPIYSGYPAFDELFSVTGNSEQKLTELLASEELRELLAAHPDLRVILNKKPYHASGSLTRSSASDPSLLRLETSKIVDGLEKLNNLIKLNNCLLDGLARIGATPSAEVPS